MTRKPIRTADGAGIVLIYNFAGKCGLVLIGTVSNEVLSTFCYSQSDIAVKSIDVLSAYGHAVLEGDSVIDVYQRVDASDLSAV